MPGGFAKMHLISFSKKLVFEDILLYVQSDLQISAGAQLIEDGQQKQYK